jgi:hypothetical protein
MVLGIHLKSGCLGLLTNSTALPALIYKKRWSNGSNKILRLNISTAHPRMPSKAKSGSRCRFMCRLPSSRRASIWKCRFAHCYRFCRSVCTALSGEETIMTPIAPAFNRAIVRRCYHRRSRRFRLDRPLVTSRSGYGGDLARLDATILCPLHQSGGSWVPGDLVGPSQASLVTDVPVLQERPQKSLNVSISVVAAFRQRTIKLRPFRYSPMDSASWVGNRPGSQGQKLPPEPRSDLEGSSS